MEDKKQRGGARENAGRPSKNVKQRIFYATQETEEILLAQKNKSEYINKAIEFYNSSKQ